MSDFVSDEEVQAARDRVEDLRAQVAEERQQNAANARSNENAHRKAALEAEAERFEAELAALRQQDEVATAPAVPAQPTPTSIPTSTPTPAPVPAAPVADDDKE